MNTNYKLGITKSFPCNYLPNEHERLLVATDPLLQTSDSYSWLMSQGFRRSGDQIYRPHCENCNECQSIRVLVKQFQPSRSQKRLLKKNKHFQVTLSYEAKPHYYSLFEEYINNIHKDGSMYPASREQYQSFLASKITKQIFVEIYHQERLIAVAVTDILQEALSAVYTFYSPDYRSSGLGVFAILTQLDIAKRFDKEYLYLGYQIEKCQKMNYKDRYSPYQRLVINTWKTINK
ncbi:arginyltransferase [Colwelliaceae bacterium 6471]